jgi:hypothetical protein
MLTAMIPKFLLGFALAAFSVPAAEITVQMDKPGAAVSPTLYGAFFEDINRAGDGGLYAEMECPKSFTACWQSSRFSLSLLTLSLTVGSFNPLFHPKFFDFPRNRSGGRGGIRTHGRVAPTPDFESGAFNHSATLPLC